MGVPRRFFWENLEPELGRICEGALKRFADAGVTLVDVDMSEEAALDHEAGFPVALYETVTDLNQYLKEHGAGVDYAGLVAQCVSPDVKGILQSLTGAGAIAEEAYRKALQQRGVLQDIYLAATNVNSLTSIFFDGTALPTTQVVVVSPPTAGSADDRSSIDGVQETGLVT